MMSEELFCEWINAKNLAESLGFRLTWDSRYYASLSYKDEKVLSNIRVGMNMDKVVQNLINELTTSRSVLK
jgi:hypothetical protein